ncbi:SDR family oxidoreductase [Chitinophaga sp. RCC_12]|uniref:SDR family oxidoreductase n=1 Tax=Chitinophaga sp. RCC_12 TaxID=3239226 RepID=UPI003526A1C0
MKHIVITGGNGFLGKAICRLASLHTIPVISISRGGKPENVYGKDYQTTTWVSADIFQPGEWKKHLQGACAVIHCIGILEEKPDQGITYERMIFTAAKIAGITTKSMGIDKFVYISAGAGAPDTPAGYMASKTAAEAFLSSNELGLDLTILKPGMLYGLERPETIQENEYIRKLLPDPVLGPEIKPNRPLPVESVAKVALYAAINTLDIKKLFVDDIERLSSALNF